MFSNRMTAYFETLADFHPSVLRWADGILKDEPMLAVTFAITLNFIIQQAECPKIDDELAHDSLIYLIDQEAGPALQRLGISLPIPSREAFAKSTYSFRNDVEISKVLLREPLMVEKAHRDHAQEVVGRRSERAGGVSETRRTSAALLTDTLIPSRQAA